MKTQGNQKTFPFQTQIYRKVVAKFDGGKITSDAGGLRLPQVERATGFIRLGRVDIGSMRRARPGSRRCPLFYRTTPFAMANWHQQYHKNPPQPHPLPAAQSKKTIFKTSGEKCGLAKTQHKGGVIYRLLRERRIED